MLAMNQLITTRGITKMFVYRFFSDVSHAYKLNYLANCKYRLN